MDVLTLPLLTVGSALALRYRWIGLLASVLVILLLLSMAQLLEPLLILIALIAILNIISLTMLERFGTIYTLPAVMLIATIYAFYTDDIASLITCLIVVGVPTYALVLISKELKPKTAIKYVTFMVVATILFVLGVILIQLKMSMIGSILLLIGLALEVGVAPFHEWVPDVFSEADPVVVAVIASLSKFVPFLIAFKILSYSICTVSYTFIFALALVSMLVGNIGALTSNEPAKILAYSTIANMGYVISALIVTIDSTLVALAFAGAFIQLLTNSAGKIGFFVALKDGANRLCTLILAFSMIGVPPLLGFWGKFFILTALVKVNLILAVILAINSVISVPYYVRLARILSDGRGVLANGVVLACVLISLLFIYPNPLYESCLRLWEVMS